MALRASRSGRDASSRDAHPNFSDLAKSRGGHHRWPVGLRLPPAIIHPTYGESYERNGELRLPLVGVHAGNVDADARGGDLPGPRGGHAAHPRVVASQPQ